MVGNDVVDLRDEGEAPVWPARFDARVFCEPERDALDAAPERARLRWQLWAAKEAAYKVAVKRNPATIFSPSRFRVELQEDGLELRGHVETPVGRLPARVSEAEGVVHGVVHADASRVISGAKRARPDDLDTGDPEAPSRGVRRFAIEEIARALAVSADRLEIRKRGRIPELWLDERRTAHLSLSHHGAVIGFACALEAGSGEFS